MLHAHDLQKHLTRIKNMLYFSLCLIQCWLCRLELSISNSLKYVDVHCSQSNIQTGVKAVHTFVHQKSNNKNIKKYNKIENYIYYCNSPIENLYDRISYYLANSNKSTAYMCTNKNHNEHTAVARHMLKVGFHIGPL